MRITKQNKSDGAAARSPRLKAIENQSQQSCTKPKTVKLDEFAVFFPPAALTCLKSLTKPSDG